MVAPPMGEGDRRAWKALEPLSEVLGYATGDGAPART